MTRLTTCADAEAVAVRAAAIVQRQLQRARAQRGTAHLALSGGATPGRAYELLAGAARADVEDWRDVHVWFADERCVAPDDEESNYRLAAQTLIGPAGIPAERVHRMEGEQGPERGAESYARVLGELVPGEATAGRASHAGAGHNALPALDVIVLGIGPDGHVASLFPGAATLDAGERTLALGVRDSPKPPPERITLSLAVLRTARSCVLLATGASKADAVSAMLGEPTRHVPASLLRRGRLTVIVDDQAAPAPPRAHT